MVLCVAQVYVFSKFTVKPANRNYSSLSFDYALNMGQRYRKWNVQFGGWQCWVHCVRMVVCSYLNKSLLICRSEVHECVDQDITDIEEKIDATKLAQLPKYLGRQVIG